MGPPAGVLHDGSSVSPALCTLTTDVAAAPLSPGDNPIPSSVDPTVDHSVSADSSPGPFLVQAGAPHTQMGPVEAKVVDAP